ncbi:MAG: discoidin domain-containing protein [Clostridia bacterium]|nr:discoidin domain-containing protein [Clostridia bacterium]
MLHIAAPMQAAAAETNLALGKPVTQDLNGCGVMGGHPGDLWYYGYLTDGKTFENVGYDAAGQPTDSSYGWYVTKAGADPMNASAIIDLGAVYEICRVKIYTEYHFIGLKFPNTYDIYVSADGTNWTKVFGEAGRTGYMTHAKVAEFEKTPARYVKTTIVYGNDVVTSDENLDGIEDDGGYVQYAGIGEIEVYDTYATGNIALNKTSKESVLDVFNTPDYAALGYAPSHFVLGSSGQWNEDAITGPTVPFNFGPYNITGWIVTNFWQSTSIRQDIDLHAVYNINQIKLVPMAWNGGWMFPNSYDIFVSEDGDTWTRVYNGNNESALNVPAETRIIDFAPINARYISIAVYHGTQVDGMQHWTGLGTVEVYGTFVSGYAERSGVAHFDAKDLTFWKRDNAPTAPFTAERTEDGIRIEKLSNSDPGWAELQGGDTNAYFHIVLPDTMKPSEYPFYAIEAVGDRDVALALCYDNGWTPFVGMTFGTTKSLQVTPYADDISFAPFALMSEGAITINSITFYKTVEDYQRDIWERGYATYGVNSASVKVGDSLTLTVSAVFPPEATTPRLKVTDAEGVETVLEPVASSSGGLYYFDYANIYPQKIADVIAFDLLDGTLPIEGINTIGYSVQSYFDALYNYPAAALGYSDGKKAALDTLLADLLTFGAASQIYKSYNTENLADSLAWVADTKTPANSNTPVNVKGVTKTTEGDRFIAATLLIDNAIQIKTKFEATNAVAVKFTADGRSTVVPAADWTADGDKFTALSAPLLASKLSKTVTVTLLDASDEELAGITYSVESYIASGACSDAVFTDALLNYGRSARAFINDPDGVELVTMVFPEDNTVFDKTFAGDVLSLNMSNASAATLTELGLSGLARNAVTQFLLENYKFTVEGQVNYSKSDSDRSHTSAFTYASGKVMYKDELRDVLAVVIEGTESEGEWYSNIDFAPSHSNDTKYSENFLAIAQDVFSYIEPLAAGMDSPVVLFTGFSRGAAAANLLGTIYNAEFGSDDVFVYTFATPNTVRSADVAVGPNIFNVVNPADLVTRVPFDFIGYFRAGNDIELTPEASALSTANTLMNYLNGLPSNIKDIYETKYNTNNSGTNGQNSRTVISIFESVIPSIFTGNTSELQNLGLSAIFWSSNSKLAPIKNLFTYALQNMSAVQAAGSQHTVEIYFDMLDAL